MSKDKIEKALGSYDRLLIAEEDVLTAEHRLESILERDDNYDFIQLNISYIDSKKQSEVNNVELKLPKSVVESGMPLDKMKVTIIEPANEFPGAEEDFFELSHAEAIQLMSTILKWRKKQVKNLNEGLDKIVKE
jgi:hypothetical protein